MTTQTNTDTTRKLIGLLWEQKRDKLREQYVDAVMEIIQNGKDAKQKKKAFVSVNPLVIEKIEKFDSWIKDQNNESLLNNSQPLMFPFSDGFIISEYDAEQGKLQKGNGHEQPEWLKGDDMYNSISALQNKPLDLNNQAHFIYVMFVKQNNNIQYYVGQTKRSITNRFYEEYYAHDKKMRLARMGIIDVCSDFVMGLVDPEDIFVMVIDIEDLKDCLDCGEVKTKFAKVATNLDIMETLFISMIPKPTLNNPDADSALLSESQKDQIKLKLKTFNPVATNQSDNNDLQNLEEQFTKVLEKMKDEAEKDMYPVARNEQPKGTEGTSQ